MINYIREQIPIEELLAQLAEEANELAHAALKLRRTYSNINPTPVTRSEAWEKLIEEIADVELLLQVLDLDVPSEGRVSVRLYKTKRWAGRIKERREKGQLRIEQLNEAVKNGVMSPGFARRYLTQLMLSEKEAEQ